MMSARPTRPPTTTPPIAPALTDFGPEPVATWMGVVEADEKEEEEEEEGEVIDEEVMLDVLVPLR
jgi:hypothetical protein